MLSLIKFSLFFNIASIATAQRTKNNRRYLSSNATASNTTGSSNATEASNATTAAPTTTEAPKPTTTVAPKPKEVTCGKGFATYEKDNTCPKDHESILSKCTDGKMRKNKDGKCPTGYTTTAPTTAAPTTTAPTTTAPTTTAPTTAAPSSSRLLMQQEQDDLDHLRSLEAHGSSGKKHPGCDCFPIPATAAPSAAPSGSSRVLEAKLAEVDRLLDQFDGAEINRLQRLLSSSTTTADDVDHCVCKEVVKTTAAPKETTSAPKETTTPAPEQEALNTTAIPEGTKFEVTTTVQADIEVDLTNMNDTQKTGLAQGLAFGLHESACNGVSAMHTNNTQCMLGQGIDGVEFNMAMGISTDLVATQPTVSEYLTANRRRLQVTKLENKGDFKVIAPSATVAATAQSSIQTAIASGGLSAANVKASLTSALQARASTIGADALASAIAAVAAANITTTDPVTVTVPPVVATAAPATSTSGSADLVSRGLVSLLLGGVMFLFTC